MWRGMRAELDGDLETAARYADEVAELAEAAQSTQRRDDGLDAALADRPAPRRRADDRRAARAAWRGWRTTTRRLGLLLRAAVRRVGRPRAWRAAICGGSWRPGWRPSPSTPSGSSCCGRSARPRMLLDERDAVQRRPRRPRAVRRPLGGRRLRSAPASARSSDLLSPSCGVPGSADRGASRPGAQLRPGRHGVAAGVPRPGRDRRRLQGHARPRRAPGPAGPGGPCARPGGGRRWTRPARRGRRHRSGARRRRRGPPTSSGSRDLEDEIDDGRARPRPRPLGEAAGGEGLPRSPSWRRPRSRRPATGQPATGSSGPARRSRCGSARAQKAIDGRCIPTSPGTCATACPPDGSAATGPSRRSTWQLTA